MFAFLQSDDTFFTRCRMLSGTLLSSVISDKFYAQWLRVLHEAHSYVFQLVDKCCTEICVVQLRSPHYQSQVFGLCLYPICHFARSNNTSDRDVPTHPRWVGHSFHAPLFQPGILLLRTSEPKHQQL